MQVGPPPFRQLKVFAFDPGHGREFGNHATIRVPYERLEPGPVGGRLAVVDYDPAAEAQYAPVDLDSPEVLVRGGLDPSEASPHFHQQMVYAVASKTLAHFDFALGRRLRWSGRKKGVRSRDGRPLLALYPHALREANAFYDAESRALYFGSFRAAAVDGGQTVFACLSHDIVAHETAHAALDAVHEHLGEATGPDAGAFHEAFADLVAMFQHFEMSDALVGAIRRSGGALHRKALDPALPPQGPSPEVGAELGSDNPLVGLAWQFGTAVGKRGALRHAVGTAPDPRLLETTFEPHARGALLVAAVFDAYFTAYVRRTADLFQIAGIPRRAIGQRDLSAELASRLAREASSVARHFLNMCIRALDYCPPVDMTFGDFLRALITADADLVRDDDLGYRAALIEAFRRRGIRPEGVRSYAEESLAWEAPSKGVTLSRGAMATIDAENPAAQAAVLHRFVTENARALRLDPGHPIQVGQFRSIWRIGPDGQGQRRLLLELMQKRAETTGDGSRFVFRGGTTAVFDAERGNDGGLLALVAKPLDDENRLRRQRAFLEEDHGGKRTYVEPGGTIDTRADFAATHRGT